MQRNRKLTMAGDDVRTWPKSDGEIAARADGALAGRTPDQMLAITS